jgi:hypothetical protein
MIFCGQCGLQLAPGTTRCPRCGTTIEETNTSATEMHPDDATIASQSLNSFNTRNPAGPSQVSPPQPLILRPGANSGDYGTQMAYDATSRVEAPNYGTQVPQNPNVGPAYPSHYPQQSGIAYPTQGNYPDLGTRTSGTYAGGGYPNAPQAYQQPYTQPTNRIRITALVLILLGVLFVLIAVILFALQRANTTAGTTPTNTVIAMTATLNDTQLAQQTVQQYHNDIHKQNYQDAYNLWQTPQQSFAQFRSGLQYTKHDEVSFGNAT